MVIKVFLVDDEIVIREAIRTSFPWSETIYELVGEAPDGEMALPMIRDANPDILLTDIRMPFMDGIQLCQEIRRTMPWVSVVILSGYDDFTYARQAISMGVKEYLLKPVSAKELLAVLDRVSAAINEERAARQSIRRIEQGNQYVVEKLLSTVFMQEMNFEDSQKMVRQMRSMGINLSAPWYCALDIAFAGDQAGGRHTLRALAESSVGSVQICASGHGALGLVLGDSENDLEERVYSFARSAVAELERIGATEIIASIGDSVSELQALPRSVQTAKHVYHVLRARPGIPQPRIIGARELGDNPSALPDLNIRPLQERLQYTAVQQLPQVLAEYADSMMAANIPSPVVMEYLWIEAQMTAARMVRQLGGDPQEVLDMHGIEGVDETDRVCLLLQKALLFRNGRSVRQGNPAVARARVYLSENYSNPILMLQDVAKVAGMSSSRFSTVFAQETGYTFTEYLSALRIGKAKELLQATSMKSSEIALLAGYNDPHYFSYIFKKSTGLTPSEYRRQENIQLSLNEI